MSLSFGVVSFGNFQNVQWK